jgi:hypothetical protein
MTTVESELSKHDRAAWSALQKWLSSDVNGRTVLELLVADPDAGGRVLLDRLRRGQVAPEVANHISGGNIEKIVTVARAQAVNIINAAPEQAIEMKSGFAFVLERVIAFVFSLLIAGIICVIVGGAVGGAIANQEGATVGAVIGGVFALGIAFVNASSVSRRKGILVQ